MFRGPGVGPRLPGTAAVQDAWESAKWRAQRDYAGQVTQPHSLLARLSTSQNREAERPLMDLEICAQAFTFIVAGESFIWAPSYLGVSVGE